MRLLLIACLFTCLLKGHPVRLGCSNNVAVGESYMGASAVGGDDVFKIVAKSNGACGTQSVTEFSAGSTYCVTMTTLPSKYTIQAPAPSSSSSADGVTFSSGASGCTNKQFIPSGSSGTTSGLSAAQANNQEFTVGSSYSTSTLKVMVGYANGYGQVKVDEVIMNKAGEPASRASFLQKPGGIEE